MRIGRLDTPKRTGASAPLGTMPDATEPAASAPEAQDATGPAAQEGEADTVTLYGTLNVEYKDSVLFIVEYDDEAGTVAEFEIPKEKIVSFRIDNVPEGERQSITIGRAYAIEAEIIAGPEDEVLDAAQEKSCASCAHRDVAGDDSCASCGDDLLNFVPIVPPQGQTAQAEAGTGA